MNRVVCLKFFFLYFVQHYTQSSFSSVSSRSPLKWPGLCGTDPEVSWLSHRHVDSSQKLLSMFSELLFCIIKEIVGGLLLKLPCSLSYSVWVGKSGNFVICFFSGCPVLACVLTSSSLLLLHWMLCLAWSPGSLCILGFALQRAKTEQFFQNPKFLDLNADISAS